MKILIIQTAFIGDVILATVVIEKLKQYYPEADIDFLVRKGNESLLKDHPHLHEILIWNKKENKNKNLWKIIQQIRQKRYDVVVNLQRFASTGIITAFSKAKNKIGFDKNPFSLFFTKKIPHLIEKGKHEVERNLSLIAHLTDATKIHPKLYPSVSDFEKINSYQSTPYICIAPTSVWFTKQLGKEQWIAFLNQLEDAVQVYLLGSPQDVEACAFIKDQSTHPRIENLSGKLSLLESAALMKDAIMNYVNDSAPMHLASAMNAPTTVVFCSTIPSFGFGPLSEKSFIVETQTALPCRPCGLHGHKDCPQGHFLCSKNIQVNQLLETLP
jgi:ADP-heptose:LPS heptosyltransferase